MYKVIRFTDRITDILFLLFFLLLLLIGGYTIYDTVLVYDAAGGRDLSAFRPLPLDERPEGYVWDMSALSDDVVAWLTVDGTEIDYPVMQGADNNEYLNKDPFGKYSLAGSIFLDSRNKPDFSDPYSLIYGHHMEYGKMFGALDAFLKEDYFDSHRTATLMVADAVYSIKFFACLTSDASVKEIFAPTETSASTLEYVREHALIWCEPEGEKLIALSTCRFPQTTERIILFGVLKDA